MVSNAGFIGMPVAAAVYGNLGLLYASVFLIPQRIFMWSYGLSMFTTVSGREVVKKIITHPCIIACFVGLILMLTQWQLPAVAENTITTIGNCNTALSMMVIGMILADANIFALFDKEVLAYSLLRLLVMPVALYAVCLLLKVPALVTGVCVILTGMPAGATTSILASKYHADEIFATRLVVASTILSMVTIPIWSILLTAAL